MIEDEETTGDRRRSGLVEEQEPRPQIEPLETVADADWVIETVVCPFHCLYQDALSFHTQSRLARSESEASRTARAALLLYVSRRGSPRPSGRG